MIDRNRSGGIGEFRTLHIFQDLFCGDAVYLWQFFDPLGNTIDKLVRCFPVTDEVLLLGLV